MKNVCLVLIILVTLLIMSSCVSFETLSHKSINMLKNSTISFSSLPVEIKEYFFYHRDMPYMQAIELQRNERLYICNTTFEYELKNVRWLAWDPHWLLIDKTNNITYRLSYFSNIPTPVIVFDKEIFIPTNYNIFSMIRGLNEDEIKYTFKRYFLESDRRFRKAIKIKDTVQNPP